MRMLPEQATAKLEVRWTLVLQAGSREGEGGTPQETDAWSAGRSTAGQRALRLDGARDWTPVYSGAAQAAMGGASAQALSKKVGCLVEGWVVESE